MALYLILEPDWSAIPLGIQLSGRKVSVGRARERDLVLPDVSIAPRHFSILKRGPDYLLNVDTETSPTFLFEVSSEERVLLAPDAPRVLHDGARIQAGTLILRVHKSEPEGEVEWVEPDRLAKTLVQRALAHHGHPSATKDVNRALAEIFKDSEDDSKNEQRPFIVDSEPNSESSPDRSLLTLGLLLLALALALAALYWLLLPETPRSL